MDALENQSLVAVPAENPSAENAQPEGDPTPVLPVPSLSESAPQLVRNDTAFAVLREVAETVALFAFIFVISRFAVGNFIIIGQSMEPNYHQDQRLLVDRLAPTMGWMQRGDVVILHSPDESIDLIKRLIGLPGDTVEIRENRVYVNGAVLNEPYLPEGANTGDGQMYVLSSDEYFVMGDNRSYSKDGRSFGTVKYENFIGRALLLYYPFNYFHVVRHHDYQ